MPVMTLTLLGTFAVTVNNVAVTRFSTDKVRALLVYLALEPRPHRREQLAGLLWPDSPQETALKNLRLTLYRLRQTLDDAAPNTAETLLATTHQTICLKPESLTVDALLLQRAVAACDRHTHGSLSDCEDCLTQLGETIKVYHGELLAGFSLPDAPAFEEWLFLWRASLHNRALLATHTLTRSYTARGAYQQALTYAFQALALDPYREESHRQVIALLASLGQPNRALAQYESCCRILREELGVEPAAETVALMEQVRSGGFAGRDMHEERLRPSDGLTRVTLQAAHDLPSIPPHNLPAQLTPFIGRERERADIVALLQEPGVRLLTLVSAGGMGKTRLALEAGQALLNVFSDGVFFVPLAPLAAPAAIVSAIATALALNMQGDLRQALCRFLRPKHMLLILDNIEHLLPSSVAVTPEQASHEGIDLILALLQAAPHVRILVTSRARLHLYGEHLYPLDGLAFPRTASVAEAETFPAVQLLLRSARRAQPAFTLDAAQLPAVLRICQLVGGMPLGLELAAAWAEVLSLAEIGAEIARNTDFLAGDWLDLPARQRSMRAVFTWSWQRLSADEQQVLARLAVFRGGCTCEAAEAIAGASLRALSSLMQASLLRQTADTTSEVSRYDMHELVRQFVAEQLDAADERTTVEMRHSAYYLAFVAAREQRLTGEEPRAAAAEIRAEIDNVRQAWAWAVSHARIHDLEQCANGLYQFYAVTSQLAEREQLFALACQSVRAHSHDAPHDSQILRALGKLLALYATALARHNRPDEAISAAQEAIALGQWSREGEALAYVAWGWALNGKGQYLEARARMEDALALITAYQHSHRPSELIGVIGWAAYVWLGNINTSLSNYDRARENVLRALRTCRTQHRRLGEVDCLFNLGGIARTMYDLPAAREYYERAWRLVSTMSSRTTEAGILLGLGDVLRLQGYYSRACQLIEHALNVARDIGETSQAYLATAALVRLLCVMGDMSRAEAYYARFLHLEGSAVAPAERLMALLAILVYVQRTGNHMQALALAEQCRALARTFSHTYAQAHSLVALGHARAALHRADAGAAYRQAINLYATMRHAGPATEARAGLTALLLEQGDLAQACHHTEMMLQTIADHPQVGLDEPFFVYLVCYRVLEAHADPRAAGVLQNARCLLHTYADQISDDKLRHAFLNNVVVNRVLRDACEQRLSVAR